MSKIEKMNIDQVGMNDDFRIEGTCESMNRRMPPETNSELTKKKRIHSDALTGKREEPGQRTLPERRCRKIGAKLGVSASSDIRLTLTLQSYNLQCQLLRTCVRTRFCRTQRTAATGPILGPIKTVL